MEDILAITKSRQEPLFITLKTMNPKLPQRKVWQLLLPLMLLAPAAVLPSSPAQANCPGYGRPIDEANQAALQHLNSIREDTNLFFGHRIIDSIQGNRIVLTPVFDYFTGPDKQQVLRTLQLDGSSYQVYTADGRLLSSQYDGCTFRTPLLTERARYSWYVNRPPVDLPLPALGEALRNAGNPSWRNVTASISPENERRVRLQFWQTVGYSKYNQGWWIGWVPEGGYFEITVVRADDVAQVNAFIDNAPQEYRFVILANDGTRLSDNRYSRGNPWQWVLGETSKPDGWRVSPCDGEGPFLCVSNQETVIGTVELQRWALDQYPDFQGDILNSGLVPGLITYDNPDDREKVLTALKTVINDYYETIRADRAATYGTQYEVVTQEPEVAQIGSLPGLVYGFSSRTETNEVAERYVSYIAFDGSNYLYIMTTGFDPLAETSTFEDMASLEQFEPYLKTMIDNLNLPHWDW